MASYQLTQHRNFSTEMSQRLIGQKQIETKSLTFQKCQTNFNRYFVWAKSKRICSAITNNNQPVGLPCDPLFGHITLVAKPGLQMMHTSTGPSQHTHNKQQGNEWAKFYMHDDGHLQNLSSPESHPNLWSSIVATNIPPTINQNTQQFYHNVGMTPQVQPVILPGIYKLPISRRKQHH